MVMKDVRDAIAGILDRTSLQDVLDRVAASGGHPRDSMDWVI
jgi:DNA-binding IscR family transcriptional regulator